jgi:hypothetical protein
MMYFLILLTIGNPQRRMDGFQFRLLTSSSVVHVIELSAFGQALIQHLDRLVNPGLDFICEHARNEIKTWHFQCSAWILREQKYSHKPHFPAISTLTPWRPELIF